MTSSLPALVRRTAPLAAAATLLLAGCSVGHEDDERSAAVDQPSSSATTTAPTSAAPEEWRTEYWADVAVDVPADWGYGGAPDESGVACSPEAMTGPDGAPREEGGDLGWVGRPIALTDLCTKVSDTWRPRAPYVWLGAGIQPGTRDYGDGFVQETVEVDGSTVTVGSDDPALREHVLGSVRGGEVCLSELETRGSIRHDAAPEGAEPVSLRVCAYRAADEGAGATLVYAADLGRRALDRYESALAAAPRGWVDGCPTVDYVTSAWVVLEVVDADGAVVRQDVALTQCGLAVLEDAHNLSSGRSHRLSPELVSPWAVGGVRATVAGTATTDDQQWLDDYFIGPLG